MIKEGPFRDSLDVKPKDAVPNRRLGANMRFGVGEKIELKFTLPAASVPPGSWQIVRGEGVLEQGPQGSATYTCPYPPFGEPQVEVKLAFGNNQASVRFDVVAPASGDLIKLSRIHKHTNSPTQQHLNRPNSGFFARHIVGPADVSFKGIWLREGTATMSTTGVFRDQQGSIHSHSSDWIPAGSEPVTNAGTLFGWDEVWSPANSDPPSPLSNAARATLIGSLEWPIPWHYKLPSDPRAIGRVFVTVRHLAWAFGDGRVCVKKGNAYEWTRLNDPMVYNHPLNAGLNLRGQWIDV